MKTRLFLYIFSLISVIVYNLNISFCFSLQSLFASLVRKFRGPSEGYRSSYSSVNFWAVFVWCVHFASFFSDMSISATKYKLSIFFEAAFYLWSPLFFWHQALEYVAELGLHHNITLLDQAPLTSCTPLIFNGCNPWDL